MSDQNPDPIVLEPDPEQDAPEVAFSADETDDFPPRPARPNRAPHKSSTQIAAEVWAGMWGKGEERLKRLDAAGFDSKAIQNLVNLGVGKSSGERLRASHGGRH